MQASSAQTRDVVVGVFDDRDDAEDAINALRSSGFQASDVSVVARDRDVAGRLADDTGTEAGAGAATGALAGGLLGGAAGWLVGIGALAIPGIGPFIAAGPLAAALGGAALGAAGGGLVGALTGAGIPEDEAKWYDERVRGGDILVTVNSRGRAQEAQSIMRQYGGHDFQSGTSATSRSWEDVAPEYRSGYQSRAGTDRPYEQAEPAGRFGYEVFSSRRASGTRSDWRTAEPEIRREWEGRGIGSWDEHRDEVRRGWDYGRGRTAPRVRDEGGDPDRTSGVVGGSTVGGTIGGIAGAAVGGPAGLAAGAAIGGTAGAVSGDAASDDDDVDDDRRRAGRGGGNKPVV